MQDEEGTPIKQDVKKGKPRFYHQPIPWNYGMLPQASSFFSFKALACSLHMRCAYSYLMAVQCVKPTMCIVLSMPIKMSPPLCASQA